MWAIFESLTRNELLLFIAIPFIIVIQAFSHFYSSSAERRRMQDVEAALKRIEKKLEILLQHTQLTADDRQILREVDKLFP